MTELKGSNVGHAIQHHRTRTAYQLKKFLQLLFVIRGAFLAQAMHAIRTRDETAHEQTWRGTGHAP